LNKYLLTSFVFQQTLSLGDFLLGAPTLGTYLGVPGTPVFLDHRITPFVFYMTFVLPYF